MDFRGGAFCIVKRDLPGVGPAPPWKRCAPRWPLAPAAPGASPSPEGHAEASPASEPLEACASRSVGAALLAVVLAVPSLGGRSGRGAAGLRTVLFLSVSFGGGRPPHGCGLEGGLRQPSGSVPAQRLHVSAGRRATCHMAPGRRATCQHGPCPSGGTEARGCDLNQVTDKGSSAVSARALGRAQRFVRA